MNKKRIVLIAIVALLACAMLFVSCGKKEEPAKAATTTTTTQTTTSTTTAATTPSTPAAPAAPVATNQADKTLVMAVPATFQERWNPFMAESAYDRYIVDQAFVSPMKLNQDNVLVPYAGNISYEEQADGKIVYTVSLLPGMFHVDGNPVTIDDYIYFITVCSDPSYTGPFSFITSDIEGIKEYYYDDPNYSSVVAGFAKTAAEKYSLGNIAQEDYITYLVETNLEGWWAGLDSYTWGPYIVSEGFEAEWNAIDQKDPAQVLELLALVEMVNYYDSYDPETWWAANLANSYIAGNLADGVDVPSISGIKKIDDLTCTVTFNKIDIYGDRTLNTYIPSSKAYGEIKKGDVSAILANMNPVGSGPYTFQGFANNIATSVANNNYFEGQPNIGTVKWEYVPEADTIAKLVNGDIDVANPRGNKENVAELDDLGIAYDLIDNAGYGYAGFQHNSLSLNVRKGLAHLMNRRASVQSYYGSKIAQVIERPMTTVLSEYPKDAPEYYPYNPAKALEYFKADGYEQVNGKLVDKSGNQLKVAAYVGGSGLGDHPAYMMLADAAEDMAALGGEIQINDVQFAILQAAMNDGTADIFILAWGSSTTCDKSSIFRSNGGQNRANAKDAQLDALLDEILVTIDFEERCDLVSQMLDRAMDLVIELPLYQRKNIWAYNSDTVDISSLPETTTFYDLNSELWKIRMN